MHQDRGIAISSILLAIVLVALIAIAIALSSRSSTRSASTQSAEAYASAIIEQGALIRTAMERMVNDGQVQSTPYITLDTNAVTGLYNPAFGYLAQPVAPAQAFANGQNAWLHKTNYYWPNYYGGLDISNVGSVNRSDAIVLPDLTRSVCDQINQTLFHTTSFYSSVSLATWTSTYSLLYIGPRGPLGCVQTLESGGAKKYVYYLVTQDNAN